MQVETYTYDKNRRYPVAAGTRCSSVVLRYEAWDLKQAIATAHDAAVSAWEEHWGKVPWDLVQIVTTILTVQVVVELRVEPVE